MKKILKWIILGIIFIILINTAYGIYKESNIRKADSNTLNDIQYSIQSYNKETSNDEQIIEQDNNDDEGGQSINKVATEYKGYAVAANLKIDKLNIDTYVLKDYDQNAMNVCVTKFFGPDPNEVGNFCITGHNYITKNMFGYLYKLEIGDIITLTDNKNGTVEYEVYDEYRVSATDTYRIIASHQWKKRSYISYVLQLLQ